VQYRYNLSDYLSFFPYRQRIISLFQAGTGGKRIESQPINTAFVSKLLVQFKVRGDIMNKRLYPILAVLLIAVLSTSSVVAGGNIKLSASVRSGSPLQANGTMTGLGGYRTGVTVVLTGTGTPIVSCTNQGGNESPGQNPAKITVGGTQFIQSTDIDENGKAIVSVVTEPAPEVLPGKQGGCPNNNWTANVLGIDWTKATILVTNTATGAKLLFQEYTCAPNPGDSGYTCTLVFEKSYH
jgi:hypothetical protein